MKTAEERFSRRALGMKGSEIRRLFAMSMRPDMISLAGGLPAPDAFPAERAAAVAEQALRDDSSRAMQYGAARGDAQLIEVVVERMRARGMRVEPDEVLITNGAQQGLDLTAKVFADAGDLILTEAPAFIGALGAFRNYEARLAGVRLASDGLDVEELEGTMRRLKEDGVSPKFLYTTPNFHNPAGVTMSQEKRTRLMELAQEYDFLILEDDAYGELWFEGGPEDTKPIKVLDEEGRILYAGSFSKIVSPGIRLGWIAGSKEIIDKFETAKQMMDVCPSTLAQILVCGLARDGYLDRHVPRLRELYRIRRDAMVGALETHMPEDITWTKPGGGFYVWPTLPDGMNALDLFYKAIERNVAFVIGAPFFPEGGGERNLRLAFSHETPETIEEGVRRLGLAVNDMRLEAGG